VCLPVIPARLLPFPRCHRLLPSSLPAAATPRALSPPHACRKPSRIAAQAPAFFCTVQYGANMIRPVFCQLASLYRMAGGKGGAVGIPKLESRYRAFVPGCPAAYVVGSFVQFRTDWSACVSTGAVSFSGGALSPSAFEKNSYAIFRLLGP